MLQAVGILFLGCLFDVGGLMIPGQQPTANSQQRLASNTYCMYLYGVRRLTGLETISDIRISDDELMRCNLAIAIAYDRNDHTTVSHQ
jgi:hypothetical protein